ncbi:radical SAM protein [Butyrivibrio sp. CB08]|uniref:radical SAM protein n=1 Tax=Butyrivibrio sp. CB08 TaxID=2364879 RepID=UPI000EA99C09|nr:radical SAM protein [Butyrivibrio sp. CB08]RKM55963.1 radical SAM protein [Butyrivibrio sp. CB08]
MTESEYKNCKLCPRNCGVDRSVTRGYCHESDKLCVARAALHMWEEPCISGKRGSGTVFFSGCNMGCVFCQNRKISRGEVGKIIDKERLSEIFFELKDKGANNINLVTGDMFIPTIRWAIEDARSKGFDLPFLLNTSSYLNLDVVKSLDGLIDIYLPDFKYIRDEDAIRYSNAPGYVEAAKNAIAEMVRQRPEPTFFPEKDGDTIMKSGVVVRHLLMPGMLIQAKLIVKYLHENYGDNIYLSLMNQYTPNEELSAFPEINRKVTDREYDSLVEYAQGLGIERAFVQIGDTADESFIPEFDCEGVIKNGEL